MASDGDRTPFVAETSQSPESIELNEIEELSLHSVFRDEARDFTPWLIQPENLGRLAKALGLGIKFEGTEVDGGVFRADILARNLTDGSLLVIENQFGRSDHDHFGKAMTYLAAHGAKTFVWLAEAFADEHRAAVIWLNENTPEDVGFYAVRPQVMRIAGSRRGLRFDVVIAPNSFVKKKRREAGPTYNPDATIEKLRTLEERCEVSNGHCKPGTERYRTFLLYSDGMTVAEFLAKGGRLSSLRRDEKYGHIKVCPPDVHSA
jgi:hypothetical protein